jgi:DNA-binding LytR/AlgR family response regulator
MRRVQAIAFADIAGYTTMMQANEDSASQALKRYKALIHEFALGHQGEVRQFYGDGCLMAFSAAEQASRCAEGLQVACMQAAIPVRIGIHLGEVVEEDEHIYGETINIASRIESMGMPGTVLLSGRVQREIEALSDLPCESLGIFAFRHVEEPVEVFALTSSGLTVPTADQMLGKGKAYLIDNTAPPDQSQSDPIQILIVEDDMIVGAHISMVLAEAGYGVLGLIPTGEAALEQIRVHPPDLVLMDVQLKGKLDGVETAAEIYQSARIPIIFLTANSDAATFARAKATFPYAFISKPFRPSALLQAVELVVQRIQEAPTATPSDTDKAVDETAGEAADEALLDHVFVRDKDRMVKVKLSDIRYVAAERNYCRIHTSSRQYLLSNPMKSLEPHLGDSFLRTHRSFLVNLSAIEGFDEFYLYLGDDSIPLGRTYKEEVLRRLKRV